MGNSIYKNICLFQTVDPPYHQFPKAFQNRQDLVTFQNVKKAGVALILDGHYSKEGRQLHKSISSWKLLTVGPQGWDSTGASLTRLYWTGRTTESSINL